MCNLSCTESIVLPFHFSTAYVIAIVLLHAFV